MVDALPHEGLPTLKVFYDTTGIAYGEAIGRNIPSDNASGAYGCIISDGYAG